MRNFIKYLMITCLMLFPLSVHAAWDAKPVQVNSDCNQASFYPLGSLCQDSDDGKLYKGTGSAVEEIAGGTGNVSGVGNCTSGACLDGSDDGGTYIRLYDGTSAYISMTAGVRTLTILPSNTSAESLIFTFGNNDNTVTLTSGTGASFSITGLAIGSNVQAYHANLASLAGLIFADASIVQLTGAGASAVLTSGGNNYFLKSATDNSALMFATPAEVKSALGYYTSGDAAAFTSPVFTTSILPASVGGATIGSATAEWGSMYMAAGSAFYFLNDQSVYLTPTAGLLTLTGALTATGAITGASFSATRTTDPQSLTLYEGTAGLNNFRKFTVPTALTADLTFTYPDAVPTVGQVLAWGAPSSDISTGYFVNPILGTYGATANTLGKRGADATTVAASGITEDGTTVQFSALHLATTGQISGRIPVVADADGKTLSGTDIYGSIQLATGAGTWVIPDVDAAAGTGQSFCIVTTGALAIVVDADAEDKIRLNGVLGAAGATVTNGAGAAGDFICLVLTDFATDVAHWTVLGKAGTWAVP